MKRLSNRPSTDQVFGKLDDKDRDILYWKLEALSKDKQLQHGIDRIKELEDALWKILRDGNISKEQKIHIERILTKGIEHGVVQINANETNVRNI